MDSKNVSSVELIVSCDELVNKHWGSTSDPMCVLWVPDKSTDEATDKNAKKDSEESVTKTWREVGRTEILQNCLSPKFSQRMEMVYCFESAQELKFSVYDISNDTIELSDTHLMGDAECTLAQIVTAKKLNKDLLAKDKKTVTGKISIVAEEVKDTKMVTFHVGAKTLDDRDWFSKSDPFLEFYKKKDEEWQLAHRTMVVMDDLNPNWEPFQIPLRSLCGGDMDLPIMVLCYDHNDNGIHDEIGSFETTLRKLTEASDSSPVEVECINKTKKGKKGYKHSGVVVFKRCQVDEYSFLDYISGGCQTNFCVGIDFTNSNGDPDTPQSLHYMNAQMENEYICAITSLASVLDQYDTDKKYPCFGFGAKVPPKFEVSHNFPLNGDTGGVCEGISGLLEAYRTSLSRVRLSGPTNFAPLIGKVANLTKNASESASKQKTASEYFVLLILTDGIIADMKETVAAVVAASKLPMSIIIVGVGNADFSAMNTLDADKKRLRTSNNEVAERDIVQFVKYSDFKDGPQGALAKNVLAELPHQMSFYFNSHGLKPPRPAKPAVTDNES